MLVGTWKELIKKEVFDIPKIGTVNVHPSLLPKYRGPNPYMQAILHGEKYSGVTLHLMDERYDGGAILSQKKVDIQDTDTSKELREKSVLAARNLVYEFLMDLNEKIITPIPQYEKNATYFENITGDERMLDFKMQTSEQIIRTVRALHPFLPCYITYGNKFLVVNPYQVNIWDTEKNYSAGKIVGKNPKNRELIIACADGKPVQFLNLKLYRLSFLTKFYIDKFISLDLDQA